MSTSGNSKKTSSARITIVIVIAVAALFASLFAVVSIGMSRETTMSAIQVNEERVLLKRIKELPEVQIFLQLYPNATIELIESSGGYEFKYVKPYPEEGFAQFVVLYVVMREFPDQEDIQSGEQKQFGEYYYYLDFRCGPAEIDDIDGTSFSDRIWRQSDAMCQSDKRAMNITSIE